MIKKIYRFILIKIIPERLFIKYSFWRKTGFKLNLNQPNTLNEKIQWLKLNDRKEEYSIFADKLLVRDYIKEKCGKDILVPLIKVWDKPTEINLEDIPDYPVIIKCNHDSTGGVIIRDKSLLDIGKLQKDFDNRLRNNHYYQTKEFQYKHITPVIMMERLLVCKSGKIPNDFKFHCFKGKVEFIYVSIDREIKNYRKIYSKEWDLLDVTWGPRTEKGTKFTGPSINKPENLDSMIRIAQLLSERFKYIRVDLYDVDGQIYFGELTQHQGSGFEVIEPIEYDYKWGCLLDLNEEKNK